MILLGYLFYEVGIQIGKAGAKGWKWLLEQGFEEVEEGPGPGGVGD